MNLRVGRASYEQEAMRFTAAMKAQKKPSTPMAASLPIKKTESIFDELRTMPSDKGKVHACEFETGSLFRSIRFPKKVDPNKVNAEFKNGMLYLTAPVAEEAHLRAIEVKIS
jgi:hypothetical protein